MKRTLVVLCALLVLVIATNSQSFDTTEDAAEQEQSLPEDMAMDSSDMGLDDENNLNDDPPPPILTV